MKFIYSLLFILAFGADISHAQTSKGTQFLGLTVGLSSRNIEYTALYPFKQNSLYLAFAPQYSYFVADKWELGGSVGYSSSKSEITYLEEENSNVVIKDRGYSSGLFLRRHILITEKIALWTGPFVSYYHGKEKREPKETGQLKDPVSELLSTGVNLGIEFFPVKQLGISANLANISYQYQKAPGQINQSNTYHDFNAGLTNELGLSVFLVF